MSVCITPAISTAVSVNHVHSEEMPYGLFEFGGLETAVDKEGFETGGCPFIGRQGFIYCSF